MKPLAAKLTFAPVVAPTEASGPSSTQFSKNYSLKQPIIFNNVTTPTPQSWVLRRRPESSDRFVFPRRGPIAFTGELLTFRHQVKRVIGLKDTRLKENRLKEELKQKEKEAKRTVGGELVKEAAQLPSNMFFLHNEALVPPYNVLCDTNFLSHTVQRKLSLLDNMMDCLYAKCNPIITSCVMAELEKLGSKYRLALRIARDERWQRIECDHKGTYADDCIVDRVSKNRIYIVGTNDKALKQRLRKIPGVPIMGVARGKYVIERLPGALPT